MNSSLRLWALAAVTASVSALAARAQTVRTIVNNGATSERYDVVILGDGYRAAEEAKFDTDCQRFTQDLFQREPYRTFAGYYNVHTVFRASNESGADHPDATPPIYRDTAYDATYNYGGTARCLYIGNGSRALADAALAPATEGRVLVMVNDTRYGGCASTFAVSYTGSQMSEVQIHEMGHSIGGLADEYDYPNGTYTGPEPAQVNATKSSTGAKWSHWHGSGGVSAFEGSRYYRRGLFRPRSNCLMRSLGQPLCAVCSEALVLETHEHATPIESPLPSGSNLTLPVGSLQAFSFTNTAPASSNAAIEWLLDGNVVASGVTSWSLDANTVSLGNHTVRVIVRDATAFVRVDPRSLLESSNEWSINVIDPTAPDLTVTDSTGYGTIMVAGLTIDVDTTIDSIGPGAAPAHRVDHFLSTDGVIDDDDLYLGGYDAAALPSGQRTTTTRTAIEIPAFARGGIWYLGTIVDRADVIREADETNNTLTRSVWVSPANCGPVLEFRDDLLYPKDAATIGATAGTRALPTVTSTCHVGKSYIIVWGCSGTSPGIPLGNGLTLPIALDGCTGVSIGLQNTTSFANFFGVLDGNGRGDASFELPGLTLPGPLPGHFAAAVLDPTRPAFLGVSNAVSITVDP